MLVKFFENTEEEDRILKKSLVSRTTRSEEVLQLSLIFDRFVIYKKLVKRRNRFDADNKDI